MLVMYRSLSSKISRACSAELATIMSRIMLPSRSTAL